MILVLACAASALQGVQPQAAGAAGVRPGEVRRETDEGWWPFPGAPDLPQPRETRPSAPSVPDVSSVPYADGAASLLDSLLDALTLAGAAAPAAPPPQAHTAASALAGYADRLARTEKRRAQTAQEWGLPSPPLLPPPPPGPDDRPDLPGEPGTPPVIERVPTDDRVVFLTIDDGAEKDPDVLRMLRDLDVPVSGFLADHVARDDYGYFRQARRDGARMHNHTVNHPEMPRLSYAAQREEICRQQDVLAREIGERPTLFRPPYGAYDRDTLRAAADCGVRVIPLWAEEAFPDRIEWSRPDRRFHPGDIILTHFRGPGEWGDGGTMTDMLRRVLTTATSQGFAVARLEDYIG